MNLEKTRKICEKKLKKNCCGRMLVMVQYQLMGVIA